MNRYNEGAEQCALEGLVRAARSNRLQPKNPEAASVFEHARGQTDAMTASVTEIRQNLEDLIYRLTGGKPDCVGDAGDAPSPPGELSLLAESMSECRRAVNNCMEVANELRRVLGC